jgi:hypothetical protein
LAGQKSVRKTDSVYIINLKNREEKTTEANRIGKLDILTESKQHQDRSIFQTRLKKSFVFFQQLSVEDLLKATPRLEANED